jgi:hypothetical protein
MEDGTAGAGMVIRDEEGQVIQSACCHLIFFAGFLHLIGCADALEAETLACMHGLTMVLQCCQKPIMVDTPRTDHAWWM